MVRSFDIYLRNICFKQREIDDERMGFKQSGKKSEIDRCHVQLHKNHNPNIYKDPKINSFDV